MLYCNHHVSLHNIFARNRITNKKKTMKDSGNVVMLLCRAAVVILFACRHRWHLKYGKTIVNWLKWHAMTENYRILKRAEDMNNIFLSDSDGRVECALIEKYHFIPVYKYKHANILWDNASPCTNSRIYKFTNFPFHTYKWDCAFALDNLIIQLNNNCVNFTG